MTGSPGGADARLRPGQPGCRFCGATLDPHQAVRGVCADRHCEMQRVQEAARAVFHRNWEDYVARQRQGIERSAADVALAARQLGGSPETIAIGVVPRQDSPVVPLPDDRRAGFAAHLDKIIAEAFAAGEPDVDPPRREADEAAEHPLISATCASCQGKCCFLGNLRHAFLTVDAVQLYRLRHPEAASDEIKAHYLARLPDEHVRHSCVYHGGRGCVLPRRERADICNRYHCNPQADLLRRFKAMPATRAIIVADEDDVAPAVGLYDVAEGWRPLRAGDPVSLELGPPEPDEIARTLDVAMAQVPPDLAPEPGSVPPPPPACAWCGRPIDRHRAATTRCCGRPACERRRIVDIAATVERQQHDRHIALMERAEATSAPELDRAAARLGVAREALLVGVVPYQGRPVEPLPTERRAAFEAHLRRIAAEGFAAPRPEDHWSPDEDGRHDEAEPALVVAACSTCQGSCCRLGEAQMAFLTLRDVCRYRLTNPSPSPEGFVARYLDRLPAKSVPEACVFQSSAGCTVPRAERAGICNSFRCMGLHMMVQAWNRGARAAAIVAHDDGEARAIGIYDPKMPGRRPVPPGADSL